MTNFKLFLSLTLLLQLVLFSIEAKEEYKLVILDQNVEENYSEPLDISEQGHVLYRSFSTIQSYGGNTSVGKYYLHIPDKQPLFISDREIDFVMSPSGMIVGRKVGYDDFFYVDPTKRSIQTLLEGAHYQQPELFALGITADQMVLLAPNNPFDGSGDMQLLIDLKSREVQPLPPMGNYPLKINSVGQITGVDRQNEKESTWFYDPKTGVHQLLAPGPGSYTGPFLLSEKGHVVGLMLHDDTYVVFIWDQLKGLRPVPFLPSKDASDIQFKAINDSGRFIGKFQENTYFFEEGRSPAILGKNATGLSLNNKNQVVGSVIKGKSKTAFIWEKGKGIRDLNTCIKFSNKIHLDNALKITHSGLIVGQGTFEGKVKVFLLIPN